MKKIMLSIFLLASTSKCWAVDPTSNAGLMDWWTTGTGASPTRVYKDTATLVTTFGDSVKLWVGVNGSTWSQYNSGNQPQWDSTLGAIADPYGTPDFFTTNTTTAENVIATTQFWVVDMHTLRDANDGTTQQQHHFMSANSGLNIYYDRGGLLATFNATDGTVQNTATSLHSSRCLIVFDGSASSSTFYVNGVATTRAAQTSNSYLLNELMGDSSVLWPMNGELYDFGYYSGALSQSQLATLLSWAQTSRGVQNSYLSNTVFDGDSLTAGSRTTMNENYQYQMKIPLTHRTVGVGEGSLLLSTMLTEGTTLVDPWVVQGITNVDIIWGGTNDYALNAGVTTGTVLTSQENYDSARKSTFTKVGVLTMLPRPTAQSYTDNVQRQHNQNLRVAFSTGGLHADFLVDVASDPTIGGADGGGTGNNYNTTYYASDNIHLTNAGQAIVANLVHPFWAPLVGVAPSSYLVTGPTTGTRNVATSSFTVTVEGGNTCNGTQSVTITAIVNSTVTVGGAVSVAGNNTGNPTVTPNAGVGSFTFTIIKSTAGVETLKFTDNQDGWTDPANMSMTISSASATTTGKAHKRSYWRRRN